MTEQTEIQKRLPPVRGEYKFAEPMSKYTWLNVGGPAEIMFFPEDREDLQFFLQHKPENIPVFVVGSGSNLLVRDGGISGVVIKLKNKNFADIQRDGSRICCGTGLKNAALKKFLLENKLGGLEFLCSVPGSLGGALRTNAGCFGSDISKVLHSATVINGKGEIFKVKNEDFHFAYRQSHFPEDWIVLEVCLEAHDAALSEIEAVLTDNETYRKEHQPQNVRTAGSTFKNPEGKRAWELIKTTGAAELTAGGASMSPKHCNFLINDGTATAADIEHLGQEIIDRVKTQTDITLEWEIKIVGREKNTSDNNR